MKLVVIEVWNLWSYWKWKAIRLSKSDKIWPEMKWSESFRRSHATSIYIFQGQLYLRILFAIKLIPPYFSFLSQFIHLKLFLCPKCWLHGPLYLEIRSICSFFITNITSQMKYICITNWTKIRKNAKVIRFLMVTGIVVKCLWNVFLLSKVYS